VSGVHTLKGVLICGEIRFERWLCCYLGQKLNGTEAIRWLCWHSVVPGGPDWTLPGIEMGLNNGTVTYRHTRPIPFKQCGPDL